jgi:hypothetical protein
MFKPNQKTSIPDSKGVDFVSQPLMKRWIHVEFVKEGVHCYPAAATDPNLATGEWDDVSFLASPHFHYFTFKVTVEVFQNDRDIEFIQFSRWCQRLYDQGVMKLNSQSCEMLAESLIGRIADKYKGRDIKVSVLEDNINGATLEYVKAIPVQTI